MRHDLSGNHAPVRHAQHNPLGRISFDPHHDAAVRLAVMQRIADQVRDGLPHQIVVPATCRIALAHKDDLARALMRGEFVDYGFAQRRQFDGARLQLQPAALQAREVEQLVDHAGHPQRAALDARRRGRHRLAGLEAHQILRRRKHRPQRRAQIVAQHGHQHLVGFQHLARGYELRGQLTLLLFELHENIDLRLKDARIERLVEEIHRAGFVAAERPRGVLRGRRQKDDRHVRGTRTAAHQRRQLEAVHAGHIDVENGERHLVLEQQVQCGGAGIGHQQVDFRSDQRRL